MFSIGQVIGESVYEDDFSKRFGDLDGLVAFNLDEQLKGRKHGIAESMAVKEAEVWELLDGLIVY